MLPVWTLTLRPHPAFEEQDYSFRKDQLKIGNIRLGQIKHSFIFQDRVLRSSFSYFEVPPRTDRLQHWNFSIHIKSMMYGYRYCILFKVHLGNTFIAKISYETLCAWLLFFLAKNKK
jgi:hypothetical protein